MRKSTICFVFVLLCALVFCSCDGYLYVGDGWQGTPEKALQASADNPLYREELTVSSLLDTWYIDDRAYMLFISASDSLIEADFVTDKKGRFHQHAYSEEAMLDKPDTFVLNGEEDQYILSSYSQYGTQVWGYKYSSVSITVNGLTPEIKTYTFTCQGQEWSIDRWWIEQAAETEEVNIEYLH